MDPRAVEAYMRRDWDLVAASKRAHWATRFREDWLAPWRAAQQLFDHIRAVQPDFPSDQQRRSDLAAHLVLREQFDRAAHAFARR